WTVVGGGSAGCVLAARLSADPSNEVTLLESGPARRSDDRVGGGDVDGLDEGPSFFEDLADPERTHRDLTAIRVDGQPPTRYMTGRGLGGSGAVNAMIALPGGPFLADHLVGTELAPEYEWGAVDRALVAADPDAGPVPLTRRDGRRVTVVEAYLDPIRSRPNLEILSDVHVDRVVFDHRRAIGIETAEGVQIAAEQVVVSAGAIHSPAILLRSGVDTPGVGEGLKDHPSAPIALRLIADAIADPSSTVATTMLRRDGLQVLPMNHLGARARGYGLLMPAVMNVHSAGRVSLVDPDPHVHPHVEFRMLSDPADVAALVKGVELTLGLLRHPAFEAIVTSALIDDRGTTVDALDSPERIAEWLPTSVGDYVHASCTCRIGVVVDDDCRVNGYSGLYVCDASVFADIPPVNTHIPTVMLAETMAARWLARPA
ncbi:MAG TPA: GMC oxidoreductase, partial [Ilumatobacteraceae bacterium]|nr:GMC oxidoreductase [Ilumatobacteraceae bacterium]